MGRNLPSRHSLCQVLVLLLLPFIFGSLRETFPRLPVPRASPTLPVSLNSPPALSIFPLLGLFYWPLLNVLLFPTRTLIIQGKTEIWEIPHLYLNPKSQTETRFAESLALGILAPLIKRFLTSHFWIS